MRGYRCAPLHRFLAIPFSNFFGINSFRPVRVVEGLKQTALAGPQVSWAHYRRDLGLDFCLGEGQRNVEEMDFPIPGDRLGHELSVKRRV